MIWSKVCVFVKCRSVHSLFSKQRLLSSAWTTFGGAKAHLTTLSKISQISCLHFPSVTLRRYISTQIQFVFFFHMKFVAMISTRVHEVWQRVDGLRSMIHVSNSCHHILISTILDLFQDIDYWTEDLINVNKVIWIIFTWKKASKIEKVHRVQVQYIW